MKKPKFFNFNLFHLVKSSLCLCVSVFNFFFAPLRLCAFALNQARALKDFRARARARARSRCFISRVCWILTLLVIMEGCIKPNYTRQCVELPESWRLPADQASTLCNYHWWEQFNDPVLSELIFIALRNNQNLKVAIARVCEFYARLKVINADLYPNVTGTASYSRNETSIAAPNVVPTPGVTPLGFKRFFNIFEAFISLNWELDFWGRAHNASEAAYADLLSEIQARRTVVLTVVTSVAEAYITLRQFDAQLQVSQRTLKSRQESLQLAIDRYNLGETSELEVRQAEAELEIAAIRLIEFERAIPQQENLLSILLGEYPQIIPRGLSIDSFQYPISIPAGLPSELLARRPDIVEAEETLIAANARVAVARALYFPQISLTGIYGSESERLRDFLTSPAEMWQWGVTAVQTIFDAGRTVALVDQAKAIRDEALFNYRQTILTALREVEDALNACQKNQWLVEEHLRQVKVLNDYLYLANLRYSEGEVDYLNVLDAQRSLFDAQLQLVQSYADNYGAVVQLYGALGGGWIYEADAIATMKCP